MKYPGNDLLMEKFVIMIPWDLVAVPFEPPWVAWQVVMFLLQRNFIVHM